MSEMAYNIKRVSISDQILAILKDKIISGEWKPGDKIPSESDLAKMFGTSRLTTRTALQRLSAIGLLDVRVGDGTYIRELPFEDYLLEASNFIISNNLQDDLSEYREFFERDCMILACTRRTDTEIQELYSVHDNMRDAADKNDLENFIHFDMEFHWKICQMTHNQYFMFIYRLNRNSIEKHYRENTDSFLKLQDPLEPGNTYNLKHLAEKHKNFIVALENRDPLTVTENLGDFLKKYKDMRSSPLNDDNS